MHAELESVYRRVHCSASLTAGGRVDPLYFPRLFESPSDQEAVAWIASSLAFGRVETIGDSIRWILARIAETGISPGELMGEFHPREHKGLLDGLVHRWVRGRDLELFLWRSRCLIDRYGSLESAFVALDDPEVPNVRSGLIGLSSEFLSMSPGPYKETRGSRYLLPNVALGSASKRVNLFLRWVVRPADGVDLGLWRRVSPARLVVPVDTHIARIARFVGFTRRATVNWAMAEEITAALARFDGDDPVRFDFALCHLGILGNCPSHRDEELCRECQLLNHCTAT